MVQQRPTSGQICGNQATVEKIRRKEIPVLWKGTVSMGRATELRSCQVTEEAVAVSCSPSSSRMLTLPVLCLWPQAIPFQGSFRLVGILRICPAIQILLSLGGMSKTEHFRLKFQTPGCKPKNGGFLRSLLSLTQGFSNISSLPQPKLRSLWHVLLIIKLLFRIWEIELLLDHCRFMWHSNTSLTQPTKPAKEHRMSRSTKHRQKRLNCYSLYIVC